VVKPYGVDLSAFTPPSAPRSDRSEAPVKALFVGQMCHRKGVRVLLEAARRCVNSAVHFTLIGPVVSPEVLLSLPTNVTYAGSLPPSAVADAMRAADLFILPSLEDACALVVLEAMATGLPVITTDQNGSSERIVNGENGFVVPAGDVSILTDMIKSLVLDRECRIRIGRQARITVSRECSWDIYGSDLVDTFRRTVIQ
jgi:glycosyltransferase involved in cell wall biosynthesis